MVRFLKKPQTSHKNIPQLGLLLILRVGPFILLKIAAKLCLFQVGLINTQRMKVAEAEFVTTSVEFGLYSVNN